MSSGGSPPAYQVGELLGFATALFRGAGLDPDKAGTVAEILVEGDLLGHSTHGLALAAPYLAALDAGCMTREGDPVVVSDCGGSLCWDGGRLPGPWLVVRAIEQALGRVPEHGIAAVAIRESHHIGCLGSYLERATAKGCMILLTCPDPSEASVAPYGGREALFTPDPIAVGIPTDGDPILIDMSASITTNGLTGRLHREGRRFPGNWAMTARGEPTDDPGVLFADPRGTLLPTGGREHGHKGYNLALTTEALSQGLAGHGRADRPVGWGASVYLQVMDPAAFGGAGRFVRQTGFIAAACRSNPPVAGVEAVRLPGQQGLARRRQARAAGVPLYPGIMDALVPWAERFEVVPRAHALIEKCRDSCAQHLSPHCFDVRSANKARSSCPGDTGLNRAGPVDLLIVGGGINGAGIARDAAGRGLKVVLCEQGDLANYTSSASSKLIHGGLRYLEQREFGLVRKALIEREVLLRVAPHIVRPLRFILPHSPEQRRAWMIRLGLLLYNHLGGRKKLPRARRIDLRHDPVGVPLKDTFRTAFTYPDCWVEDARLVVLNALDAHERGAEILTRTRCAAARRANELWYAELTPTGGGPTRVVRARALVNATGPWVLRFLTERTEVAKPGRMRLVKGSHIIVPKLYHHGDAYTLQHRDGRVVFVLPYEGRYSLIGTTEVDYDGDPGEARITRPEIVYLCDVISRYFREPLKPDRVLWTFSGVRPLYDDAETNISAVTRDYAFDLDRRAGQAPLLSILGGKITTYRRLAEHALEKLEPVLGTASRRWTAKAPLPGGDLPHGDFEAFVEDLHRGARWLPSDLARRYARAYGSRATKLLARARDLGGLGEHLGDGLYEAEVEYLRRHEWAATAEDILWRRSRLGLHVDAGTVHRLEAWLGQRATESRSVLVD